MKQTSFRFNILAVLACGALINSAYALESATTGSQATQATVGVINSKVDITNNFINSIMKCNAVRKFYAPSDPKKDTDGCVGTGDYDLNMASGSNVNFANGRVYATQEAASNYGGLFYGNDHGAYGVGSYAGLTGTATGNGYGVLGYATADSGGVGGQFSGGNSGVRGYGATFGVYGETSASGSHGVYGNTTSGYGVTGVSVNNVGVRGASTGSWGGYFTGTYGVFGQTANGYGVEGYATAGGYGVYGVGTNSWGGVFRSGSGQYGVYGEGATYGVYSAGPLCINGSCITSWGQASRFGGAFATQDGWCYSANPQTGGCSCPGGYGGYLNGLGFSHITGYICQK